MRPATVEIPALTGIRAVAAFMVFLRHYPLFSPNSSIEIFLANLCNEFHTGVTLFFVLSGFLLAHLYYDVATIKKSFLQHFYERRVVRIYPIFLLLSVAALVYGLVNQTTAGGGSVKEFLWSVTFIKAFSQQTFFYGIPSSWSLTVEMCFYLVCPFIFVGMKRLGAVTEQVILFLLIGFLLVQLNIEAGGVVFFESRQFVLSSTFFGRSFEFFAGILAALYCRKIVAATTFPKFTLAAIAALIFIYAGMAVATAYFNVPASFETLPGVVVQNYILPIPFAFLLIGLVTERSRLQQLLASRIMVVLGKASYCFYLLHVSFVAELAWSLIKTGNHILNMAIGFIVLNLFSVLIFYMIEQPLHHWLHHARLQRWGMQLQILGLRCSFFVKNLLARKPQLNN